MRRTISKVNLSVETIAAMATIDEKLRLLKLDEIIGVLKNDSNQTLTILELIQKLISLFEAHTQGQDTPTHGGLFRREVINRLQVRHALVIVVVDNLETYLTQARASLLSSCSLKS